MLQFNYKNIFVLPFKMNNDLLYDLLNEYMELKEVYLILRRNTLQIKEKREEVKLILRKRKMN